MQLFGLGYEVRWRGSEDVSKGVGKEKTNWGLS